MKIKFKYLLITLVVSTVCIAQKQGVRISNHAIDKIVAKEFNLSNLAFNTEADYILNQLPDFGELRSSNSHLKLKSKIESPFGIHYTYEQYINNIKVYRSFVKVNILKNNKSHLCHYLLFNESIAEKPINTNEKSMYFYDGQNLLLSEYHLADHGDGYFFDEIIYQDNIIYQEDLTAYSGANDTTATGTVFYPDPVTSAQTTYGAPYDDNNDADHIALNEERNIVDLKCSESGDTIYLFNEYVAITDFEAPTSAPVYSLTNVFDYNRFDQGFEDINVIYHITRYKEYLMDLGFPSLVNYRIDADPHGANGADQSSFKELTNPPQLTFGEGGVDDAEDADVIVHEYGHAISASAAPFTKIGNERKAFDEAVGDYIAASYSRTLNEYNWENVFSWDGHNEYWSGRIANTTKHYPEDMNGSIHLNGEMWSSTLMQLWEDIGQENIDKIFFQSMYGLAQNLDFTSIANLMLEADSAINNGFYTKSLGTRLYERGFIPLPEYLNDLLDLTIEINATDEFAKGNALTIQFNKDASGTIDIYDISGKRIDHATFTDRLSVDYFLNNISHGVYFIKVSTDRLITKRKLIRYQ